MQIPDIKQKLSLLTVIHYYGLSPDRANRLLCPFHSDKNTKSLQLYPKTNTFFCFGCNKTGDVIDFIMFMEGCNKQTAINKAVALIGNGLQKIDNEARMIEQSVYNDYTKIFKTLRNNIFHYPQAQNYCYQRKIDFHKLEIGYNPGKTFNKLKYCIVFPLKDKNGTITGLYGRSTINNDNAKHFYTANRKGLYPCWPTNDTTTLVLTEAIIDATCIQPEITKYKSASILSLFGSNGLTHEHEEAITALPDLRDVFLFFDGDKAGRDAVLEYYPLLKKQMPAVQYYWVETTDNEDINNIYVKQGKEAILRLLAEACPINPKTSKPDNPFTIYLINN